MRYLRANTAVIITVGPFYDKTDGVTIETALTITNERISFVVDNDDGSAPTLVLDNVTGATSGTSNDLNYITNCDAGLMQLELAAANVNYAGKRAYLTVTDAANHVPVFHEFHILKENVYDALAGTDNLQTHAVEITNDLITAAAIANGAIDANTFAAGAIDAAAIANSAIDNATFAADVGSTAYATNIIALAVNKALVDLNLDHLLKTAAVAGDAVDSSIIARLASKSATPSFASFDNTTDSLEANTDQNVTIKTDTAAILLDTGTDGVVVPQAQADKVWGTAARTLTAATNITSGGAAIPVHSDNKVFLAGTTHTGAVIPTVSTLTGHTAQTGDVYAQSNGANGFSAIYNDVHTNGVVVASASKSGYALSSAGIDAIFDQTSNVGSLSFESLLGRLYQMISDKMTVNESNGNVTLRNIGDTVTIATGNVASSSGTTTRAELTWV